MTDYKNLPKLERITSISSRLVTTAYNFVSSANLSILLDTTQGLTKLICVRQDEWVSGMDECLSASISQRLDGDPLLTVHQ